MQNKDEKSEELENKATGKVQLKNDNPNNEHNVKKESMGQNTKR